MRVVFSGVYDPVWGGSRGEFRLYTKDRLWEECTPAWVRAPRGWAGQGMNRKLLVIEDDPVGREILRRGLSSQGWEVLEATDGQSGIDMAEASRPRVVICDLHIPVLNGFHVCRRIRENPQFAGTKIIVLTASRYTGDSHTALESGADHYLIKPVSVGKILELLPKLEPEEETAEVRSRALTRSPFGQQATLVRFWGVRGSIPVPGPETVRYGGNTTCIEIWAGGERLIVDAGTGIRLLGQQMIQGPPEESRNIRLLITHTHWDHIQGLPFFTPAYIKPNRIEVYGFSGAVQSLRTTVLEQMKSVYFPVSPSQLAVVNFTELRDTAFAIGEVRINTLFTNHPGICLAYRFQTADGSIVCLGDHEVYEAQCLNTPGTNAEDLEFARRQDDEVKAFIQGADILVADAQFDASEYPSRVGWGHSCIDDVVKMAHTAGVGRLLFTHHAPEHSDAKVDGILEHARKLAASLGGTPPLQVDAAREGAAFVLSRSRPS